jgi:hypothetical protein
VYAVLGTQELGISVMYWGGENDCNKDIIIITIYYEK